MSVLQHNNWPEVFHQEAQKAMSVAHDKLLRGRKIVVTYAHHAPLDSANSKSRRAMMEIGRPTTLSLLKSGPLRPLGHVHSHFLLRFQ